MALVCKDIHTCSFECVLGIKIQEQKEEKPLNIFMLQFWNTIDFLLNAGKASTWLHERKVIHTFFRKPPSHTYTDRRY